MARKLSKIAIKVRDLLVEGKTLEQICNRTNKGDNMLMDVMRNNNGMGLVFVKRKDEQHECN